MSSFLWATLGDHYEADAGWSSSKQDKQVQDEVPYKIPSQLEKRRRRKVDQSAGWS
jgi:hypothetical protein